MATKYVSSIQNGKVTTSEDSDSFPNFSNDAELADLVRELIKKEYAFVDQPAGWPPAAILQNLHDKGLLDESFTAITWTGPNASRLYTIKKN
jgi:hypothetical protein